MKKVMPVIIGLSLFALGCQMPQSQQAADKGKLVLSINLTTSNSRTLVPAISLDIARYDISGTGPNGATFSQPDVTNTATVDALTAGSWMITASGVNADGMQIGMGSAAVSIVAGQTTSTTVAVLPLSGNGDLSLAASWTSGLIMAPSVTGTLTPLGGSASNLSFTLAGNTLSASYDSGSTLPAGYYTLSIVVKDGTTAVWGGIEAVRIASGSTTTGNFALTHSDLTAFAGNISISITPAMNSPIQITLSGQQSTLSLGASMTVVASSSVSVGSYQWFLNGAVVNGQTSSTYSTGTALSPGNYRLDVIGTQGSVLGSSHCTFQVIDQGPAAAGPAPVNLGTAGNYVILAKTSVANTGSTAIVGDIGINASIPSLVGFSPSWSGTYWTSPLVAGKIYTADTAPSATDLTTAILDMQTAYADAAGRALPIYTGDFSGQTLPPGLYKWNAAVSIGTSVTLSGGANDTWIFQIAGALNVASGARVTLTGGAQAKNIVWQVGGAAVFGTASHVEGTILAGGAITLQDGASVNGRLLTQTTVTLLGNTVTTP